MTTTWPGLQEAHDHITDMEEEERVRLRQAFSTDEVLRLG